MGIMRDDGDQRGLWRCSKRRSCVDSSGEASMYVFNLQTGAESAIVLRVAQWLKLYS
jgi:hypothetical protein